MKLMDIVQLDEEKMIAALRGGKTTNVYKNPTPEELKRIALHGVVKGILTPTNFIGYDFQNVDYRDLPPFAGYPVVLYLTGGGVTVQLLPYRTLPADDFDKFVHANTYLKHFTIKDIMVSDASE